MFEHDHPDLSISQQCALLQVPRTSFDYAPQGQTRQNLALMRLIDVHFLVTPFLDVQKMTWHLRNDGHAVNEKLIRRLMGLLGVRRENGPPDRFLTLLTADPSEAQHQ
ncbi:transposase [Paracoccus aestuarii]|uniref:Transposase n=2 Tax=Paracoccus aestuarii TaxID=453842 RepID=A0A418ZWZ9_9RHOB|nr:transposase [Paracoccus aestuarii]